MTAMDGLAMVDRAVIATGDLVTGDLAMDVQVVTGMDAPMVIETVVTATGIEIAAIDAAIGAEIGGMELVVRTEPITAAGTIGTTAGIVGTAEATGFVVIMALGSTTSLSAGNRLGAVWVAGTSSTTVRAPGSGGVGARPLA
ncbi:MAG: hypothetical protein WEE51_06670 [Pirellulaceae bacterium]